METWLLFLFSICIFSLLKLIFNPSKSSENLPPGPSPLPIIGNLLLFRKSFFSFQPVLRSLHAKFGPIITLHFGTRPAIFIADRTLAYDVLVKEGSIFSDRPPTFNGTNQNQISTAFYGSKWRLLRRNLTGEVLQSSRLKTYLHARKWAIEGLLNSLKLQSKSGDPIQALEHFKFSMFSVLVYMCFGLKFEDSKIKEIEEVVDRLSESFGKVNMIYMTSIWPKVTKFVFRKLWNKTLQAELRQREVFIPLIKERKKVKEENSTRAGRRANSDKDVSSYLDQLFDLHLPEENRKLNDEELISLCTEFLSAGTHTTTSALQWVMANLVKYPHVQEKLFMEIKEVVGNGEEFVKEDDLLKMPYLKAVIFECLRRHPPGIFLMPHAVTQDVVLKGYTVPKNGTVNVLIGDMGLDPKVWDDPLKFKPERFLSSENGGKTFYVTGGRENIEMMPFGAGRRICPGHALAILHLGYFVANLVWSFEWKAVVGDEINMETKQESALTMKNPLQANLIPRF